jgi:hypothetical protein
MGMNNLYREFDLVTNMTCKFEIKWKAFARFEPIRHLSKEDVLKLIKAVPFLTFVKGRKGKPEDEYVRIEYENSRKVLLVTGISKEIIDEQLREFKANSNVAHFKDPKIIAKVVANNGYWITI